MGRNGRAGIGIRRERERERVRPGARPSGSIKNRLLRRRVRFLGVINFADMLHRMRELETDALPMPAGRKAPAHGDLVRHVGMRRVAGDSVDAGLRDDFARPVFLRL
jgi:hypothetical protein